MTSQQDLFEPVYPQHPGYKVGGTSQEAAEKVAAGASPLRALVLECLCRHPGGLIADEIAAEIGRSPLGVRPRISELLRLGAVRESGERRTNPATGMTANVWVANGTRVP